MEKANPDLSSLTSQLQNVTIPKECGVSFAGKGLKLNESKDAQIIVDEISQSEMVEYLNMEGNSLGVNAAKEIAKVLETRKEFKKALWKDMFTSRLKTEIPIALKHLTGALTLAGARLEVLDLSDNASGPIGVEGFEEFLRSPSCYSLRELRLNNMGLGVTGAKKLASALLDLYNNSKNAGEPLKLEVFIAGRNRLENPGATALANVFQKIGTLREISIPQNGIYHPGISALSAAFNENLSLQVINLNDNTVTEKGARALSKVLGKLSCLKSLDLGDCLLHSKGAIAVSETLSSLRNLESVNLSFNEVKGVAGTRILKLLAPLSSNLLSLNMDGNMFGPTITEDLVSTASQLHLPLASLSEDEGDIGDDGDYFEQSDEEDDDAEENDEDEDEEEEDTESDQPYNIDRKSDVAAPSAPSCEQDTDKDEEYDEETGDENNSLVDSTGISPMRSIMTPQPALSLLSERNAAINFLSNPTKNNFICIPDPKAGSIIEDVYNRLATTDERCEELIRSVVVVAALHASSELHIKESVMRTSINLFQEITSLAEKSKTLQILNDRIPVHFGYLKDENTNKKKAVPERDSCLIILHAAMDSNCLPKQTRNIITSIEACIKG